MPAGRKIRAQVRSPVVVMPSGAAAANGPVVEIRRVVVEAIVIYWPALDYTYAVKVVRDIGRGTCAVSDGWRVRLEALAGATP